jgi:leader peptidase (prepilin peptidase)/N-methyltransferase
VHDLSLWQDYAPWISLTVLGALLAALSWIDLRTGFLPFSLQIPLGLCGLLVAMLGSPIGITWHAALTGAVLNAAVFAALRWLVTRWKQREAMGQGDIWLVGVGGLWLGPIALPYIMAVGGLGTLVGVGIVSAIVRRPLWRGQMPLGPGLAVGIFGCFIVGLMDLPWLHFDRL